MNGNAYEELKDRQREEFNNFPIAYAFNDEQLKAALKKLGVESTKECVTVFGHWDIVKKENAPKLIAMMKRHDQEVLEAMKNEEFAEVAFLYEMNNHEYAINWDGDDDVLGCFSMNFKKLREMGLEDAYRRARQAHFKQMEEWDVI
jgi:hypothetical protein